MTISLPEKIAKARKALGLTQEKLGAMLGVSPQAVSKWENSECLPDLTLLPQLCAALRVSADELLNVPPQPVIRGTARVAASGIHIRTPRGVSLSVDGAEAVDAIRRADLTPLRHLLADDAGLALLREIAFAAVDEGTLAARCSLSPEATQAALLRLLKAELCQCSPEGYALGANIWMAFALLAAGWLISPEGSASISTITNTWSS